MTRSLHLYSVVYGFKGSLMPAFMAAVADFNTGNMLLTLKFNIFAARMRFLLLIWTILSKRTSYKMLVSVQRAAPAVFIFFVLTP